MEITTSTGVRGTALSGGPPTKATDDGSLPLTGKAPAEAPSVGGEKPTTTQAPADDVRIAAARAVALLRSGEDGSIPQEDAEALFKYLVDNKDTEAMQTFYDHVFGLPAQMHLGKLIGEKGAEAARVQRTILQFMGFNDPRPTLIMCDNMSAVQLSDSNASSKRMKHIATRIAFLREAVKAQEIMLYHIRTTGQLADIFTKPLAANVFHNFRLVMLA